MKEVSQKGSVANLRNTLVLVDWAFVPRKWRRMRVVRIVRAMMGAVRVRIVRLLGVLDCLWFNGVCVDLRFGPDKGNWWWFEVVCIVVYAF